MPAAPVYVCVWIRDVTDYCTRTRYYLHTRTYTLMHGGKEVEVIVMFVVVMS